MYRKFLIKFSPNRKARASRPFAGITVLVKIIKRDTKETNDQRNLQLSVDACDWPSGTEETRPIIDIGTSLRIWPTMVSIKLLILYPPGSSMLPRAVRHE